MQTLVELCAGSAAVSLRWLHPRAKPPIAYQGGKRAYADAILLAMGLRPGGGQRAGRVVLVEAGPWGEAWAWWAAGGIPDTVARLRAWAGEDPRALWTRLAKAPVPTDCAERVATWAVLQFWQLARKPVFGLRGAWRTFEKRDRTLGFNASAAYFNSYLKEWRERTGGDWDSPDQRLPNVIRDLSALASVPWSRVQVLPHDCIEVEPIPGAHVYIDPDYQGTTGYGHTFPRPDVVEVAERWKAAGCTVAISEAEPLPISGWYHHELGKPVGNRRTWSKQKREWLTMSHRPVGVLDFGGEKSLAASSASSRSGVDAGDAL